jgi:hypothetical protein
MTVLRRDSRLDRVYQCVKLDTNRYVATCETGIAVLDKTLAAPVCGWVNVVRPFAIVKRSDTEVCCVNAAGEVLRISVSAGVPTIAEILDHGVYGAWVACVDTRVFWPGTSVGSWKDSNGKTGSFNASADFVQALDTSLYVFSANGFFTVFDTTSDKITSQTAIVDSTEGIAVVEIVEDVSFSYVSMRSRVVYTYTAAVDGYAIASAVPYGYVDGLPGDVPWWNQPGVVPIQPNIWFGNGFVEWKTLPAPVISPAGGEMLLTDTVTLTSETTGAAIHYTIDGTAPTDGSPVYTSPFTLPGGTATVRAIAIKEPLASAETVAVFQVSLVDPSAWVGFWDFAGGTAVSRVTGSTGGNFNGPLTTVSTTPVDSISGYPSGYGINGTVGDTSIGASIPDLPDIPISFGCFAKKTNAGGKFPNFLFTPYGAVHFTGSPSPSLRHGGGIFDAAFSPSFNQLDDFWHSLIFVYDGTKIDFYLDGILVSTVIATATFYNADVFGLFFTDSQNPCLADNVFLYDGKLSDSAISALAAGHIPNITGVLV